MRTLEEEVAAATRECRGGVARLEGSRWAASEDSALRKLLAVETVEGVVLTVEASAQGFCVVGDEEKLSGRGVGHETLDSLLLAESKGFAAHFHGAVAGKLQALLAERGE